MAISLTCPKCGKGLRVKDEWAGKKIKCPQCGTTFPATGGGGGAAAAGARGVSAGSAVAANPVVARAMKKAAPTKSKEAAVHISWGLISGIVFVVLVVGGIIAFRMGPV